MFKGNNLGLLYQNVFKDDNFALLIKCYMHIVVVFEGNNLALK